MKYDNISKAALHGDLECMKQLRRLVLNYIKIDFVSSYK